MPRCDFCTEWIKEPLEEKSMIIERNGRRPLCNPCAAEIAVVVFEKVIQLKIDMR